MASKRARRNDSLCKKSISDECYLQILVVALDMRTLGTHMGQAKYGKFLWPWLCVEF